jgi:Dimerisation domain of Zinc Transporter
MPIPLVERSDRELGRKVRRNVQSLGEVASCKEVTVGFTRKKPSIHFHVLLNGNPSFEETHKICSRIDREVRHLVPNARVVIHSESSGTDKTKDVWKIVKRVADGEPGSRGVQNIHVRKANGNLGVDFSLQVSTLVTGTKADELESRISQKIRTADPHISEVVVHQESVPYLVFSEQWGQGTEMRAYVEHVSKRFPEIVWLGPPIIRRMNDGLYLADRVAFTPGTSADRASQIRLELGAAIKNGYPGIARTEIIEEQENFGEM